MKLSYKEMILISIFLNLVLGDKDKEKDDGIRLKIARSVQKKLLKSLLEAEEKGKINIKQEIKEMEL